MFETELYHTLLILAAISNLSMAASLLHGNLSYGDYTVYRWARRLVALCFTVFAIGFFLHDACEFFEVNSFAFWFSGIIQLINNQRRIFFTDSI